MSNVSKPKFGELVPIGGGDPIPLLKDRLRVGRRDGCDIVLNFSNISGHHALMEMEEGYWFVRDLKSRNGVKVDVKRINVGMKKRLDPGTTVRFAKHEYELDYDPHSLGAYGSPPQDEQQDEVFGTSLLNRAGLKRDK
ncbi:MAG: FHA domain-containing protein [Planctomycetota bacterium]